MLASRRRISVVVEFPQFIAVAAPPLARGVATLVLEAHRDAVPVEIPETLAQRVVPFSLPFGGQECDDLVAAGDEDVPVTPHAVARVRLAHPLGGVTGVPRVLRGLDFLECRLQIERW